MSKTLFKKIRHPLVANSFYLYIAHFADYIFSLLILPFIARILGPEELGYVATAQIFGLLLLLIMEFGFSLTATREVSKLKEKKALLTKYINESFSFKFFLIPLIIFLSIFSIISFPTFQSRPHYIGIVMVGSIFQGMAPTWFFQGIEKLKVIAISKILFRGIGFIIIFVFIRDYQDGWIVLMGSSITSFFIFLYLINYMQSIVGKIKITGIKGIKSIWKNSRWTFLLTLIPVLFQNGTALILSTIVSPLQMGLYFGATKIYRSFNTLYGPFGQAIYPRLIASNQISPKISKYLVYKVLLTLFSLGLIFFILLFFWPDVFIKILLGDLYLEASITLKLYGIVLPLTAVSHVLGRQWMLVKGEEKTYLKIILTTSLFTFIFLVFSVDFLGIKAAPISLIIFEICTIFTILFRK